VRLLSSSLSRHAGICNIDRHNIAAVGHNHANHVVDVGLAGLQCRCPEMD
jgi:hypothetical protein